VNNKISIGNSKTRPSLLASAAGGDCSRRQSLTRRKIANLPS